MSLVQTRVDRVAAAEWYARNRRRTRAIFDMIDPAAYYTRPISLSNPIVFYEGHLPAFSIIAFINRGLGRDGVDPRLEQLFARGIDPESEDNADASQRCVNRLAAARRGPRVRGRRGRARGRCDSERTVRRVTPRHATRRRTLYRARARSDAPGNTPLYVAPPAARTEGASRIPSLRTARRCSEVRRSHDSRR